MVHSHDGDTLQLWMLAALWFSMMAVMMAPAVWPWIRAFHRFAAGESSLGATVQFTAGYLVAWLGYSLGAAALQAGIAGSVAARWRVALFAIAGFYQFAPLKRACLTHCRSPLTYFLTRWRSGRNAAMQMGLHHGLFCVGCCWALMLTMLAVGVTSLLWMAALGSGAAIEQIWRHGHRLRAPIGVALVAVALWQLTTG